MGIEIGEYVGDPANDDAEPVTTYMTPQQALAAELKTLAPRMNPAQFTRTYAGSDRQQFSFAEDGNPRILINLRGGSTWRVVGAMTCTNVVKRYQ